MCSCKVSCPNDWITESDRVLGTEAEVEVDKQKQMTSRRGRLPEDLQLKPERLSEAALGHLILATAWQGDF